MRFVFIPCVVLAALLGCGGSVEDDTESTEIGLVEESGEVDEIEIEEPYDIGQANVEASRAFAESAEDLDDDEGECAL